MEETKLNYVLLSDEEDEIIVPESEVFECISDNFDCVWVSKDLYEQKGKKTFDYYSDAMEFYQDYEWFNEYEPIPIPPEGKYICVYCSDGNTGSDPYEWDYDSYCYRWWNGSNWNHFIADYSEELELIDKKTINTGWINYGRDEHYYLFSNEKNEYIIGYSNDGYAEPISVEERFDSKSEAIEYIESLKV